MFHRESAVTRTIAGSVALFLAATAAPWLCRPVAGRGQQIHATRKSDTTETSGSPSASANGNVADCDRPCEPESKRVTDECVTMGTENVPVSVAPTNSVGAVQPLVSPFWSQVLSAAEDGPISPDEWQSIGGTADSFQLIDRDGDGRITFDEISAATTTAPASSPPTRGSPGELESPQFRSVSDGNAARDSTSPRKPRQRPLRAGAAPAPASIVQNAVTVSIASLPKSSNSVQAAKPFNASAPGPVTRPTPAKPLTMADDAAATTALPLDDGSNPYWIMRNQQNLDRIATGENARVLFLGDSATDLFSIGLGKPIWEKFFVPVGSVNFAVGGATTSQVLWQIETRQVERVVPQTVVVLIGSNNLAVGQSPSAVARGVTRIVNELQTRLPQSRILLLGLLPRQAAANDPIRAKLLEVNRLIAALDDGASLRFIDFSGRFLEADGSLSPRMMPDFLHPSLLGYQIYAASIWPTLLAMLN